MHTENTDPRRWPIFDTQQPFQPMERNVLSNEPPEMNITLSVN